MRTLFTYLFALFLFAGPVATVDADAAPTATLEVVADEVATYEIDTVHSEMSFRIRHLMGRVFGVFNDWEGTVQLNPADLTSAEVDVTVQTASINTFNEQRDNHLRTDDFFDVENYPTMTFKSTKMEADGNNVKLHGDLTIRGVTKPVVLTGEYTGQGPDPWGGERVAFIATTNVDRQDFGVSFNQLVDGTGMIGDEVEISIAIEAVRQ